MSMKYAYLRQGGPLLTWGMTVPQQARAADARSLGSLGGTSLSGPTLVLPRPGAPEPVGVTGRPRGMDGCSCQGSCGCGGGVGDAGDAVFLLPALVPLAGVALVAWLLLRKKRR